MENQSNLNCNQMEDALDAYHDLELDVAEAEAVERHLESCADCSARLADIEMIATHLKALPAVEMKRDLSDDIESRILALKQSKGDHSTAAEAVEAGGKVLPFERKKSTRVYWLAGAAAVLALLFAVDQFNVGHPGGQSTLQAVAPVDINSVSQPTQSATPHEAPHVISQTDSQTPQTPQTPQIASQAVTQLPARSPVTARQSDQDISSPTVVVQQLPQIAAHVPAVQKPAPAVHEVVAVASKPVVDRNNNSVNDAEELLALYDDDTADSASDFGISTNEDGLYAIKL